MVESIIPAEIKNDELYERIITTIHMFSSEIKTVLEVGASSGDGSTEALITGMSTLEDKTLYTIEVNPIRFNSLCERYKTLDWVKPLNGSSVHVSEYMTEEDVKDFYNQIPSQLNEYPLESVLSWYYNELKSISEWNIPTGIIDDVFNEGDPKPDLVLLDGSPFSGYAEYKKIEGAKIIILDDTFDIKHWRSNRRLRVFLGHYECLFSNLTLRNGYSIWVKQDIL